MINYKDLKPGIIFVKDGAPWKVLDYNFVRMQQRKPVVQLKIKNLITGKVMDYTAQQSDSFEEAEIENKPLEYIFNKRGEFWFKNPADPKDRMFLNEEVLGNKTGYLVPGAKVNALIFGEKVIDIELPAKIELKVKEAPPYIKGATATGGYKLATLETGIKISVPPFIEAGDIISVNPSTGEYSERVEKA